MVLRTGYILYLLDNLTSYISGNELRLSISMAHTLTQLRRRRGVVRASITRLGNRLRELEDTVAQPTTAMHAQQLNTKLKDLDSNFKDLLAILQLLLRLLVDQRLACEGL